MKNVKDNKPLNLILMIFILGLCIFLIMITRKNKMFGSEKVDYSKTENWAYFNEGSIEDTDADVFFVCPTVDMNDEFNMAMDDEETKAAFLGATNMEIGIFKDTTRVYAPYYRQAAMKVYGLDRSEWDNYLNIAYRDVSDAFEYYLRKENKNRPIILFGFSQGADMCMRLVEEYFEKEKMSDRLVAVYAIGWPLTQEMCDRFPQLKAATGETDTGVVISFDCEAPGVTETFINPKGQKALTINPLNWKTDSTPADKSLNIGACFTDYDANITLEASELCGCYIDEERGALKVTDITPDAYPAYIPGLPEGGYHIYDYQFFFRNLQENLNKRIESYMKAEMAEDAA